VEETMIITEEEAKKKKCPFMLTNDPPFETCETTDCMAWEPDTVWTEKQRGYCKLIERRPK
jgi:hypothetical protein